MAPSGKKLAREKERFRGDEGHFEKREEDKSNDDLKIGMEK